MTPQPLMAHRLTTQRRRDRSIPILVLIAVAVAALSVWIAFTVQPANAAPAEAVPARGWTHEAFGRLVFDWTRPVGYSARIEDGRLVVTFERPAAFAFGRALPHLTGYLRDPQVSADGLSASFALARPVTLKSFTDGAKVVIDLRPAAASTPVAPAAPAPAPAVAPAPAAPAVPAPAAQSTSGAVPVRAGEHEGFSRLVFDWPQSVSYQITRQGDVALVSFGRAARLDLGAVNAQPPKALRSIQASTMADRVVARLELPPGAVLRDSTSGTSVVIDIEPPSGAAAATPAPAAPAAPASSPPVTEPAPAAAPAPAAEPGYASAPPAPAAAQPGAPVQLVPPVTTATPAPVTTPAPTAPAKTAAAPADAHGETPAQPVPAKADAAAPAKEAVMQAMTPVTIEADEDGATLHIAWGEPVAAAAFRRAGVVWVVFDRPTRFDLQQVVAREHPMLGEVTQVFHDTAGILQFSGDNVATPRLVAEGSSWRVDFRAQAEGPLAEIPQKTEMDGSAGGRLLFTAPAPSSPIALDDPEVGDRLLVVAVRQAGSGIAEGREWPDLALLPTQQGIVVAARGEGIAVQTSPTGVMVSRSGGLLISREAIGQGKAEEEIAAAAPRRLFDLAAWRREDMDFTSARQALQQAIVTAAASDRQNIARLDLARFYFAHGLAAEADGLLELIARTGDGTRNDPELLLMSGVSQLLQGDLAKAREAIGSRALDGDPEAELWRAALAAEGGEWDAALDGFRKAGDLIETYPHVTRARLQLLAAETRIEAGDVTGALDDLDALRKDAPTPDEAAQLAFLDGLRALRDARPDEAQSIWQGLTESNHQPTRARAIFQLTELKLEAGEISLADAAERLERLRFLWRGGPFEFAVMHRLGQVYLADGKPREGLRMLRQAVSTYPQHRDAQAAAGEMADAFKALYLGAGSAKVPALVAVALYDEFKELTPPGPDGDRLVAGLVDRLVEVDLLKRADALLADQIQYRLHGTERAATGARLAEIRLMDRRPEEAMAALQATGTPGLPEALERRRVRLQARALLDSGRAAEALALLEGDASREATLQRADMLWRLREWAGAADALADLLDDASEKATLAGKLDAEQAGYVLNRAIALTLAGNRRALEALGAQYGPQMAETDQAEPFKLLTDAIGDDMATRSIAEQLAAATRLQGFVADTRVTQTANVPPEN